MSQGTEQGVWRPVLGALGIATAFLTLVGNLVFSPGQTAAPSPKLTQLEQVSVDAPALLAEQATQVDQVPFAEPAPVAEPVVVADQTSVAEIAKESVAAKAAVVGQVPVAEPAPVAQQVPAAEPPAVAGIETKIVPTVVSLPADDPVLPSDAARDVSIAEIQPEPDVARPSENRDENAHTIAVARLPQPVVAASLSHHDRKVLRKIAHREKKKDRLVRHDRCIVCR